MIFPLTNSLSTTQVLENPVPELARAGGGGAGAHGYCGALRLPHAPNRAADTTRTARKRRSGPTAPVVGCPDPRGVAENEPLRPKGRMNTSTENPSPEVVGELRRVVHELKNALTPVLANAQLARSALGPDSEVAGELEDVVTGAQRANKLLGEIRMIAESLGGDTP
jgi:hypothetical protein